MGLTDIGDYANRERLKLITLEYSIESDGHFLDEPIVELFCRDNDGNRRFIEVEGFYPSFFVTEEEYLEKQTDIHNESMIRYVEAREEILSDEALMNGTTRPQDGSVARTLDDRKLVRIVTIKPSQVKKMRKFFDEHWEADVFFTNRFLVDSGISRGLSIPRGRERVSYDEIHALDEDEVPEVDPRMHTVDIEVWSGGEFPEPEEAEKPITAITAHDSYGDEYFCGILHPDAVVEGVYHTWDEPSFEYEQYSSVDVSVYYDENRLLADYISFVVRTDPDLMTGWNSSRNEIGNGFDYPYIINRAKRINEWVQDMAYENGGAFVTSHGSPVIGGREMFDMLQAYKKTQIHEKRSYALGYIAEEELGYGKEDVGNLDDGWLHEPEQFMKYNIRDTEAVFKIEDSKQVLEMYDHIRSIAGATYSEIADSNIGIIDMLFLREAKDRGLALPTSTKPDVQHYWGAYVFPPESGKHENVVYPDLSSLYPNLFRDMNVSPETIVGFADDLEASDYDEEDCHVVYVDTRGEGFKRNADVPIRTKLFVLKPDVKESFVREIIQKLIDMKYEYKKDEYSSEAYGAVKRITNSVYGVMGDSVSYGNGFRLFDWRIAEAITLAGRDVIRHTAKVFEKRVRKSGYPEANIIAGDTDSCVCEVPSADGMDETLDVSIDAAEYVDMTYDEFMEERYNMEENNMAVEIESYAKSALFMDKKKRYAQWVRWDEGEEVDEVEYKGFELVRSDSAEVTEEVQRGVIDRILKEDRPKHEVHEYLHEKWDAVVNGDVDLEELGTPSALNNKLMDYGWSVDDETDEVKYYSPQPHIRGARYTTAYVEGEDVSQGSKPLMFYVSQVLPNDDGLPETFDYGDMFELNAPRDKPDRNTREMKELGRLVDAISVDDVRNLPECVRIDTEKMAEKTLRSPIEPITTVLGWDFDDLIAEGAQTGLSDYM
jgi:DNA polymerase elongation subunit (family B)